MDEKEIKFMKQETQDQAVSQDNATQGYREDHGSMPGAGSGDTQWMPAGMPYSAAPVPKKKRHWMKALIIIAAVIIVIVIIYDISTQDANAADYGGGAQYVGVLHIEGTMSSSSADTDSYQQSWLLSQVSYMENDSSNEGILLYINSPGGDSYAADELYLQLEDYKDSTGRPVYAYFANYAASGAYYISAAADKIYANRDTTTGAIGVYMGPLIDASGLLSKVGVNATYIKSGANKAMGNNFEPLTDEQKAILQSQVDEIYDRFVQIVAKGRDMTEDQVKVLADGRAYTGQQALDNGLVDSLGTLSDAEKAMSDDQDTSGKYTTVKYQVKKTLSSMLMEVENSISSSIRDSSRSDAQAALEMLQDDTTPRPMMLYGG